MLVVFFFFFSFLYENMLWEHIRSTFSWTHKKNIFLVYPSYLQLGKWYANSVLLQSNPSLHNLHKGLAHFVLTWLNYYVCSNDSPMFYTVVNLGPVVQSVISLTSSLRVISLTVLADSIHNILIFFAEKMWVAFALQKLLTFFQQKISAYLRITRYEF